MGSPQYGTLLVDGTPLPAVGRVDDESLLWGAHERLLAVQELVSWRDGPKTRLLVIDAEQRVVVAASRAANGFCTPIRFEEHVVLYRHWDHVGGSRDVRLPLPK